MEIDLSSAMHVEDEIRQLLTSLTGLELDQINSLTPNRYYQICESWIEIECLSTQSIKNITDQNSRIILLEIEKLLNYSYLLGYWLFLGSRIKQQGIEFVESILSLHKYSPDLEGSDLVDAANFLRKKVEYSNDADTEFLNATTSLTTILNRLLDDNKTLTHKLNNSDIVIVQKSLRNAIYAGYIQAQIDFETSISAYKLFFKA